jgi:hypothetical protein
MYQKVYGIPFSYASYLSDVPAGMGYLSEAEVPEVYGIPVRGASRFKGYLSVVPAGMGYSSDVPAGIMGYLSEVPAGIRDISQRCQQVWDTSQMCQQVNGIPLSYASRYGIGTSQMCKQVYGIPLIRASRLCYTYIFLVSATTG